ncbi:hypothetical protein BpHYR1_011003 [Brachionus plicatilis]|uniref:Uncharacterized protein n=1 Tax=Brachionus plicatilis TaxID=10195 RepID=A0A3M7PQT0_BRAPC|nr:hypothetical protein BpHYR1_011003 [Brachionus plicatilis]
MSLLFKKCLYLPIELTPSWRIDCKNRSKFIRSPYSKLGSRIMGSPDSRASLAKASYTRQLSWHRVHVHPFTRLPVGILLAEFGQAQVVEFLHYGQVVLVQWMLLALRLLVLCLFRLAWLVVHQRLDVAWRHQLTRHLWLLNRNGCFVRYVVEEKRMDFFLKLNCQAEKLDRCEHLMNGGLNN